VITKISMKSTKKINFVLSEKVKLLFEFEFESIKTLRCLFHFTIVLSIDLVSAKKSKKVAAVDA
jgi:hypothetical protein